MHTTTVLTLALTLAAPAPKEAPKKETPAIVGEWKCVAFVGGGKTWAGDALPEIVLKFTADGTFQQTARGKVDAEGTYVIDPTKDLAEVDYKGSKVGKENYGIYKVEKDILTLCVTENGGARPTKFESPDGTRVMLMTLERVTKKK